MDDGTGGDELTLEEHAVEPVERVDESTVDASRRIDSGGRATTTIPRPRSRRASDAGRSRVADLRQRRDRYDRGDRIAPRRRTAWLFGLGALVVAAAIAAALFGLPVRTWFAQDDELARLHHELSEIDAVNSDLQDEVQRLQTDDGAREAIREELGHIVNGERRESLQDLPPLPRDLPDGWPYSQVERIVAVRTAAQLAAVSATSTTAVATTTVAATSTAAATSTTAAVTSTSAAATGARRRRSRSRPRRRSRSRAARPRS